MTDQAAAVLPPLTRSMRDARMAALRTLSSSLRTAPPSERDGFTDMMTAAFREGGLDVRNLADDMGYSISSPYRWIEGRSWPHPSQWRLVTDWVVGRIDALLVEEARA
jgi:hypothetical protein